jgi:competence protein ComEC
MTVLKYPIIPFTLFVALGILAGYHLSIPFIFLSSAAIVALALLVFAYIKANKSLLQKPYFAFLALLFAIVTGMLVQNLHYGSNNSSHYSHSISTDDVPLVRGIIIERLKPNDFSEKYYFDVKSINKTPAIGKLLITVPNDSLAKPLHAGDVLIIAAELKPITASLNPYQFNYAEYMRKQDVLHQVKLKGNYIIAGRHKDFNYHIQQFRSTLINSFKIHNFRARTLNVINALLFGQRQDMDAATTTNYTNAGVVHILAISGLHFSLLFIGLNWLLARLKRVKHIGRLGLFIIIIFLMWLFACITGLSASVVRAVVMFTIVMVGNLLNRRANIYNSLAVSALLLLLAKPSFLFDAGFQLSYIAVFTIVWLHPIYGKIKRSKYWLVNFGKDTVVVSLAAQIGVLPLSLYYFNQFPLLFLLANIIVIPLSNIVLVLGIVVLLLNFIFPQGAIWLGYVLEFAITVMNNFIAWIASFTSLVLKDIPFTLLLNILLYFAITLTVLWLYKQTYKRTAAVLCSIVSFQIVFMATSWQARNSNELIVFHNYNHTLVAKKHADHITVFSTDSLALQNRSITAYNKGSFNQQVQLMPLQNMLWYKGHTILILDSLAVYPANTHPEVVLLTQSPKVNLDRVLLNLQPKQVIADATNYKTYIARWAATCAKQKIPFHATAEKGFYILK